MPTSETYLGRRAELETYFDRTAAEAWARLTSDAPLSGVRATVRAGRDAMRALLLSWLPEDLTGRRVLDAGCGAGQLSLEAARRGADVVGIDLSKTLLDLARERLSQETFKGSIEFRAGDMLDPDLGRFDHIVAMDSLIHYDADDIASALARLADRAERSIVFTFAPQNLALSAMHAIGKAFPRADRAPAIAPIGEAALRKRVAATSALQNWRAARTERVKSGFYISQAMELTRVET